VPTTKQRRQNARRRLERQLVRRAQLAKRRRMRNQVIGAVAAVLLVLGAVWLVYAKTRKPATPAAQPSASASASPTASGPTAAPVPTATFAKNKRAAAKTSGPCRYAETSQTVSSPYTKDVGLPPDPASTPKTGSPTFALTTSQGAVTVKLDPARAPCTVQSFAYLAGKKFFDGTYCHRLTTTASLAVLQCGDPSGTGQGGPTYQIKDEGLKGTTYKRGTVAMANGGPNTNGSQFFLVYKDSQLPPNYTPIGTVTAGLDVLDKIGAGGTDNSNGQGDGKPILGVQIQQAVLG
jgi:peptidyl-prolyl cis-trans isomerase B (cyclophilin B)